MAETAVCETCGRLDWNGNRGPRQTGDLCMAREVEVVYGGGPQITECYRLGYAREKARADAAEATTSAMAAAEAPAPAPAPVASDSDCLGTCPENLDLHPRCAHKWVCHSGHAPVESDRLVRMLDYLDRLPSIYWCESGAVPAFVAGVAALGFSVRGAVARYRRGEEMLAECDKRCVGHIPGVDGGWFWSTRRDPAWECDGTGPAHGAGGAK